MIKMRSLFISYEAFQRNDTQLLVRNQSRKVEYIINRQIGQIIVTTLFGDELLRIRPFKDGQIQRFEIIRENHQISTFWRISENDRTPLYLTKLHWLVWGNRNRVKYRIIQFHHSILSTEITTEIPHLIKFKIRHRDDEPLCVGIMAFINYWATLSNPLQNQKVILQSNTQSNELALWKK